MIRIIGVVILYQPDTAKLAANINTYLPYISRLLVYDNTEILVPAIEEELQALNSDKIEYVFFGRNEGISKRLNQAARYAIENGNDYLLMMDQDSSFGEGVVRPYFEKIRTNTLLNVAQFGVNCQPEHTRVEKEPQAVISLITSGTVLNLRYFDEVGPFDENLFIDFVDLEFSYRADHKGFINLLFTDIILKHRIGYVKMGRSLKSWKLTPRLLHSPVRVYYIVRNGLYLLFRVKHIGKSAKADIRRSMKIVKNDLMYHQDPLSVYAAFISGVIDFIRNKMGKK